jgi:hypothetical protein
VSSSQQTSDVDGYERITLIGRGPRSEVWRARSRSGREVALKLFAPALARNPNFVTLFEKETSALSTLHHPNIVRVYERGKSGNTFFLALEPMGGGSLRTTLRVGSAMSARDVARVGRSICEALDLAHSRGIPHRRLVAENVFADSPDHVKVSDFGMALLDRPPAETALATPRADLAAVGALLYELAASRPPGPSPGPTGKSARLDEVLLRALSRGQSQPFSRASEMSLALLLVAAEGAMPMESSIPTLSSSGDCITFAITEGTTVADVDASLPALERRLGEGRRWKIAYELGGLTAMDHGVQQALVRLHVRNKQRIERVAFYSTRALVRSGVLVVGTSVKGLPWKVFAAPEAMRLWIEQGDAA